MWKILIFLLPLAALAQSVDSTRLSGYDWRCERPDGTVVSNHQRQDTAEAVCINLALQDPGAAYVVRHGGVSWVATNDAPIPNPSPPVLGPPGGGVGDVTLSWTAPTTNSDGSPLLGTLTYRLYYGTDPGTLSQYALVITETTITLSVSVSGTLYFAATAVNEAGIESDKSNIASKVF